MAAALAGVRNIAARTRRNQRVSALCIARTFALAPRSRVRRNAYNVSSIPSTTSREFSSADDEGSPRAMKSPAEYLAEAARYDERAARETNERRKADSERLAEIYRYLADEAARLRQDDCPAAGSPSDADSTTSARVSGER